MMGKHIFRLLAVAGIVVSAADLYGVEALSPICVSSGCTIVNQITPFGGTPFAVAGIAIFSFLLIVSFYSSLLILLDTAIALSLISEGTLIGYQEFHLQSFCTICVGIFIIIVLMFTLRLVKRNSSKPILVMGLAGFAALFMLSFILYTPIWQPKTGMNLIYSNSCPYCENTIKKIEKDKILSKKVHLINLKKAKVFLFNIGIKSIPVLIIKGENIKIIKGENGIDKELFGNVNNDTLLNILNLQSKDSCNFTIEGDCNAKNK